MRYQETRFARTLASFIPRAPAIVAGSDASLKGASAGLIWYERINGCEVATGVYAVDLTHLGFSSYPYLQILAEFIGAILRVLGHVKLGNTIRSLALRGTA